MFHFPSSSHTLIINQDASYILETNHEGISLYLSPTKLLLFQLKEPVLLAQGIASDPRQIHLAYLKGTGELCYSIISSAGEQQTMTLGKLDTKSSRYDRLILLPVDKVIHIFYAASHLALPDVWRITHLLWNGRTWKSAQLGEVVHPRHPLYHILLDSKANLHLLMMTFLGDRSALLANFFNGTYHIWAKQQETLSIPREVIDLAAFITPHNGGYVFWGAKQPGSEKFELGFATQPNLCDFSNTWRSEANLMQDINGPWKSLGVFASEGILNLLLNTDQERLLQFKEKRWVLTASLPSGHDGLRLIQKSESVINDTKWLLSHEEGLAPLYFREIRLPLLISEDLNRVNHDMETSEAVPAFNNSAFALLQSTSSSHFPDDLLPSLSEELRSLEEKIDEISESWQAQLLEKAASVTGIMESLEQSLKTLPETLESLSQQGSAIQQMLESMDEKVNTLMTQSLKKKGFWERWRTSIKK